MKGRAARLVAMNCRLVGVVATVALAFGCIRPPALLPPPPAAIRSVAVLPPNNRTGDGLLVAGASLIERYALRTPRVSVADVLAEEAEDLLQARGYRVAPAAAVQGATGGSAPENPDAAARIAAQGHLEGAVLYLEIRRWEADASTHPAFVIVGLAATLIDISTGRVIWTARPSVHPVATPGAVTLGTAYEIAARKVVEEILTPAQP
jgi:hypothetical protein